MNKTKTETIEEYKINYKKHVFSKSIKITLKKDDLILVTMPYSCPFNTARDFLINNFEKIKSHTSKRTKLTKDLKTKFDTLEIMEDCELKTIIKNSIVYFYYPKDCDFNSKAIQKALNCAYLSALKIEAKNYLPQRLRFLAEKYGYNYNKVSLRNQRTRFGSCSFNNNISLNINLMKYDFDVIDYVLLHELAHTKVKNHSEKFWKEVEKNCLNYRILRKMLKYGSVSELS